MAEINDVKENKTQDVKSKVKVYANDLCSYAALVGEAWPVKDWQHSAKKSPSIQYAEFYQKQKKNSVCWTWEVGEGYS